MSKVLAEIVLVAGSIVATLEGVLTLLPDGTFKTALVVVLPLVAAALTRLQTVPLVRVVKPVVAPVVVPPK